MPAFAHSRRILNHLSGWFGTKLRSFLVLPYRVFVIRREALS
jgi:hypothetical protein